MTDECGDGEPISDGGCGGCGSTPAKGFQELKSDGPISANTNLSLSELRNQLGEFPGNQKVRGYVVTSVERKDGKLVQTGTGPNVEGGLLTLCTCKRFMRARKSFQEGDWLAGFASSTLRDDRHNPLFYLARVGELHESYADLWSSLDDDVRRVKNANNNPVGDLFRPLENADGKYGPENYQTPPASHDHAGDEEWHKDVSPHDDGGVHKLVVGDPAYTYVWQAPRLLYGESYHPRQKNHPIGQFCDRLETNMS